MKLTTVEHLANSLCKYLHESLGGCPEDKHDDPICWRLAERLVADDYVLVPEN